MGVNNYVSEFHTALDCISEKFSQLVDHIPWSSSEIPNNTLVKYDSVL